MTLRVLEGGDRAVAEMAGTLSFLEGGESEDLKGRVFWTTLRALDGGVRNLGGRATTARRAGRLKLEVSTYLSDATSVASGMLSSSRIRACVSRGKRPRGILGIMLLLIVETYSKHAFYHSYRNNIDIFPIYSQTC